MSENVAPFPKKKIYPDAVKGRELWKQQEPPSEMVWAVCPYLRGHMDESRCCHCPAWEEHKHHGKVQRGCYGMAAEVCRVVFAMQVRAAGQLGETRDK